LFGMDNSAHNRSDLEKNKPNLNNVVDSKENEDEISKKPSTNDTNLLNYPKAQIRPLPTRQFVCIEYPGYIKNVQKAIETMGGLSAIYQAATRKENPTFLHLKFRFNDPYSHPIFGDRVQTSNLALKVTKQPTTSNNNNNISSEIVAIVCTTFRFNGLADFQYLASTHLKESDETKIPPNQQSDELPKSEDAMHLPPPLFTRIDRPLNYEYLPNPLFKLDENTNKMVPKTKRSKPIGAFIVDYHTPNIPMEPPPEVNVMLLDSAFKEILAKKFEERPCWTRQALELRIAPNDIKKLKQTLPAVAYFFRNGPWRSVWCRYGYDPRKIPAAKIYQILDFRVSDEQVRTDKMRVVEIKKRPRRSIIRPIDVQKLTTADNNESGEKESILYAAHTFQVPPLQRQTLYQLIDIDDAEVQKKIAAYQERTCHVSSLFFAFSNAPTGV